MPTPKPESTDGHGSFVRQEGGVRNYKRDGPGSNSGSCRGVGGGLQAFLGATMSPTVVVASEMAGHDAGRCSRTELVRSYYGDVQLAGWRVVGVVRRQEGSKAALGI